MKTYTEDPDYEKKRNKLKKEIIRMKEDKKNKYGGSLIHFQDEIEIMDKNHLFSQTQKLAKKQNKEDVVNRLIKSAKKYSRFNFIEKKFILSNTFGGVYAGVLIAAGGAYSAAPIVMAGGAVLAGACLAYCVKINKDLLNIQKARFTLKEYAKTGDLEKSQQKASEIDARLQRMLKAKTDKAFKFKNPFKTRASR